MNESKVNRVSKLEQHRTITDQKKEFCPCRCHWKYIEDFMEIPDEKLIELAEIFESLDPTYFKDLEQREKNRPKCTCDCSH